jgi:hypothetical protein
MKFYPKGISKLVVSCSMSYTGTYTLVVIIFREAMSYALVVLLQPPPSLPRINK